MSTTDLEGRLKHVLDEDFSTIQQRIKDQAMAFLAPLKYKSPATRIHYEHCMRVGLLVNDITKFLGRTGYWDAFVAGLLHDVGKALIDPEVVLRSNSGGFTESDRQEMRKPHCMDMNYCGAVWG